MLYQQLLLAGFMMLFLPFIHSQNVSDIDNNSYKTVTIGSQKWFTENLRVSKLNDGTPISLVTDNNEWDTIATPGYCWYNNDSTNRLSYGALYNWHVVNTGKLCPVGWHVPSTIEWDTLVSFLGGSYLAGGMLKEMGTSHWKSPNTGATNETDFTALPAGVRISEKSFNNFGSNVYFWTSTEYKTDKAWSRVLIYYNNNIYTDKNSMNFGFSVRCIKNE